MGAFLRQWNTTTLPGEWAKCPLGCSVLLPVVFNLKLHGPLGKSWQQRFALYYPFQLWELKNVMVQCLG